MTEPNADRERAARGRAEAIREHLETAASGIQEAAELIAEAYRARDWVPLGYTGGWAEYCRAEFGLARLRLPAEDRERILDVLDAAGLSSRALAAALGTSPSTAARALRGRVSVSSDTVTEPDDEPSPDAATWPSPVRHGLDGRDYQPPPRAEVSDGEGYVCDIERLRSARALRRALAAIRALRADEADDERAAILSEIRAEAAALLAKWRRS